MITYKDKGPKTIQVFLDGKYIGVISQFPEGWQYKQEGSSKAGEFSKTLTKCKQSLIKDVE